MIKTVSNGNHANFCEFFPHTFLSINRNQPVDKMSIFLDDPNYRKNFYLGEERENTIFLQKYAHTKVAAHILVDKPFKNCFVCKGIIDA